MADFTRQSWTRPRSAVPRPIDEEINPSSEWTNDYPGFHCLLVNLPGFNEDDVKLNVDESGIVVVSGRRKVDDEKQEHFTKSFNVPEDGDVNNIEKIFDGATLRVHIPKVPKTHVRKKRSDTQVFSSRDVQNNEVSSLNLEKPKENENPGQEKKGLKASVLLKIVANKGILLAFIISFTLVVLLSQKIHPSST